MLYIWHPLFLSIAECYIVVPIGQNIGLVPHLVEIVIMYLLAMLGCAGIHAALHYVKKGIGKFKARRKNQPTTIGGADYRAMSPATVSVATVDTSD